MIGGVLSKAYRAPSNNSRATTTTERKGSFGQGVCSTSTKLDVHG